MLKISILNTEKDFKCLKDNWNLLLEESNNKSIFLTWEWLESWWKSYGYGKKLFILKVQKNKDLISIIPLFRMAFKFLNKLYYNGLYFVGDGSQDSDYLDIIVKSGYEEKVVSTFINFLLKNSTLWDILFLNEIPEESLNLGLLRKSFEELGCYWKEAEVPCAYVNLPNNWNEYLKCLKPRMRTKIRSSIRKLENNHTIILDRCQQTGDIKSRLESLFNLHQRRWQLKEKDGIFILPEKRKFYQEISNLFLGRGWLYFYSLSVDNEFVAHQFCLEYQNTMFLLQEGFEPKWSDYGVGNVLRAYVFKDCIQRNLKVYDFLSGVTHHKLSWGSKIKRSLRVAVGHNIFKNRFYFQLPGALETIKSRMKKALPNSSLTYLNSVKSKIFDIADQL